MQSPSQTLNCIPKKAISMQVNLKQIAGNWDDGYALDKHIIKSSFIGNNSFGHPIFETERTEAGESVFKLKYKSDWSQIELLAQAIVENIVPKFISIGLVIPVPASKTRGRQPVYEVAQSVAKKIKVDYFEGIVSNSTAGDAKVALKDLSTKEEKLAALNGRFVVKDELADNRIRNALIVDDLFDTGASMEAVCAALRTYRKVSKIYVAALTWK